MKLSQILMLSLIFATTSLVQAEVRLWPVPKEEPLSKYWSVEVNGRAAGVMTARTADPPFESHNFGGEYAFLSLDADEPVTLKIRENTGRTLDKLLVRPVSRGLTPVKNADGSFELKIDRPCQLAVEVNGREHPLLVFVNKPEENIPDKNDPNVIWYGPGIHAPDKNVVSLKSGQTLYLAPGAIVQCGIKATGENIKILGRGVVDSSLWKWRHGPTGHVLDLRACRNIAIEGITIRGASHWTVVPFHCDGVAIDNIKLCGGRVQNDDGINPCNSRRVAIRNCFIRTDDDCIAAKGLEMSAGNCEDISVENCVFWCDRARIVLLGHESRADYMRRITFRNCDIIHSNGRNFLFEPGEEMKLEKLLFENIRFELGDPTGKPAEVREQGNAFDHVRFDVDNAARDNWLFVVQPTVNRYMRNRVPGHVADCTFRNISVVGDSGPCRILVAGSDAEHKTERVVFDNVVIYGKRLEKDSTNIKIGGFTDRIEFAKQTEQR